MNMNTPERRMIRKYWQEVVGGLIIWEFTMVNKTEDVGGRYLDALILPNQERREASKFEISDDMIKNQDIILVQAKNKRLGMAVLGQAVFSVELMRKFSPLSIRSIALCTGNDKILENLLKPYHEVEVVVQERINNQVMD